MEKSAIRGDHPGSTRELIVQSWRRDRRLALLLHCGSVLAGVVFTLLGPILPTLSARWHLDDAQAGWLFIAQFTGVMMGSALSGSDDRTVRSIPPDSWGLCGYGRGRCLSRRKLLGNWSPVGFQLWFRAGIDWADSQPLGCGNQFGPQCWLRGTCNVANIERL